MCNISLMATCRALGLVLCFYGSLAFAAAPVGRDPTEPAGYTTESVTGKKGEVATTAIVLDAVVISGDDKFAIINNKLVKVGDVIGSSKVKAIDNYHVTLVGETGEVVLELFGRPIKEPAK